MRKRVWFILPFLFVVLIGAAFFVAGRASRLIRERLENEVARACATCELAIGDLTLSSWSPGAVIARDVRFRAGRTGGQEVRLRVREIVLRPRWGEVLHRRAILDQIVVLAPEVEFLDGDKRAAGERKDEGSEFDFRVEKMRIEDGRFTYVRDHKGTHAVLRLTNIDVETGVVSRADTPTKFTARAQIEGSGHIEVAVALEKREPLRLDTDVRAFDQGLPALSHFFKPNAGVDLKGTLVRGHARGHLTGNKLRTNVRAVYKDFALEVDPTYDRSEVVAFFTNLGAAIALQDDNLDDPPEDQARTVETTRKEGESLVAFLLRGMKEASLKIVKRER